MMKPLICVFTPTYNRANLLPELYKSLQDQTSFNFKWLVVDDGSEDNTAELVAKWQKEENKFQIDYIYKQNGGLHTGYNTAIENMDTELCMCIDSDDKLPPNAIEKIENIWNKIKDKGYIGIVGLDCDTKGKVIKDYLPDVTDIYAYEVKYKYHIQGDKKYIHKTDILKAVAPIPTFPGEKILNPFMLFLEADKYGKLYCVNEFFCIVEYREGGMTDSMISQYNNSPRGFAERRKKIMTIPGMGWAFLFKTNIHYVSSCYLAKRLKYAVKESPKKLWTFLAFPFGVLLGIYIKRANKK
ncbi:MAG: glycosyltransferase [Abditibacteriota bacterium]|nr:glycosyltransferase [Abditibacteriota bacterium]